MKILFITHEATRTGAPMLLLNLVKWLNNKYGDQVDINVLISKNGPLLEEFKKYTEVLLMDNIYYYKLNFVNTGLKKIKNRRTYNIIKHTDWDVVFSNTIVNGKILEKFDFKNTIVVSYIHELKHSIDKFLDQGLAQGTFQKTDYYFCGSKLVQNILDTHYQIPKNKSEVIYSFQDIRDNLKDKQIIKSLKEKYQIPEENLIIGMIGGFNWRKGIDFYVSVAEKLHKEKITFVWVGASNRKKIDEFLFDFKQKEIKVNLLFIPPTKDYLNFYHIIDVFFLSSREDPYPMVIVEASSFGIPIICFENSGGTTEFIDNDTGRVIEYGNVDLVCREILNYKQSKTKLESIKFSIKEKSILKHQIDVNATKLMNKIDYLLKTSK